MNIVIEDGTKFVSSAEFCNENVANILADEFKNEFFRKTYHCHVDGFNNRKFKLSFMEELKKIVVASNNFGFVLN